MLLLIASLLSSHAFAIDLNRLQGDARKEYLSPQSKHEICVIPKKWQWGSYKNGDLEKENTLCGYDFYVNMGICPKYNSTNPAILLLEPSAKYDKRAIDASSCDVDAMGVKNEAKFKQSISCSYTPSILAYYHVSRLLGGAGRVPVAVIRSMDRDIHLQLTRKANKRLAGSKSEIAKTWAQYAKAHESPRDYPQLFDQTQEQVYGALVDNIKKEEYYSDVNGRGSYSSRYQRFLKQKAFLKVSSSKSAREIAGSREFSKISQDVTQMKDVGDMVLMDTLLNQQDRIGNVHYKFYWYVANGNKIDRIKSDAKIVGGKPSIPKSELEQMRGKNAAHIKEMILKDNDCGVSKENMMRKISALEKVRHFSFQTYRRFMAFERLLSAPESQSYFMNELLFSNENYRSLTQNAAKAREVLLSRCRAGSLKFDVDLENYLPGAPQPSTSCEI